MADNNLFKKHECAGKVEQILEAAIKVFAFKGYHNARVEEIAIEAGIGKSTIYEYFKSKQELFQEMIKYIHRLYLEKVTADLEQKHTFKEKLQCLLETHLRFILEHREMAQVLMVNPPPIDDGFKKWFLDLEKRQIQLLQINVIDGIKRDELKNIDPNLVARVVAGVISYFGNSIILNGQGTTEDDLKELSVTAIDLLYKGIAS